MLSTEGTILPIKIVFPDYPPKNPLKKLTKRLYSYGTYGSFCSVFLLFKSAITLRQFVNAIIVYETGSISVLSSLTKCSVSVK